MICGHHDPLPLCEGWFQTAVFYDGPWLQFALTNALATADYYYSWYFIHEPNAIPGAHLWDPKSGAWWEHGMMGCIWMYNYKDEYGTRSLSAWDGDVIIGSRKQSHYAQPILLEMDTSTTSTSMLVKPTTLHVHWSIWVHTVPSLLCLDFDVVGAYGHRRLFKVQARASVCASMVSLVISWLVKTIRDCDY
jgi:hypothetical protein